MKLIITIDVEEDNWGVFSRTGHTLENINRIPELQRLFDAYDVRPTYLITFPVATDAKSVTLLKEIEKSGRCEIGMHCHPWNTPPFEEDLNEYNSMLCNLPYDLQYKKMCFLNDAISRNIDIEPVVFRSGRWGFNLQVANNLSRLGYKVDTSITPYVSWKDCLGPDFSNFSNEPTIFLPEESNREGRHGRILEIPATIDYCQKNSKLYNSIFKLLGKRLLRHTRLIGILDKLDMLNKVWLTPELSDSRRMIELTGKLLKNDYKIINMFFHSTTLKAGLNEFVKTSDDEKRFLQRIEDFLLFARKAGIESIKLSDTLEFQDLLQKKSPKKDNNTAKVKTLSLEGN